LHNFCLPTQSTHFPRLTPLKADTQKQSFVICCDD